MKERMLTVLVPIKDSDATVVASLPAVTPDNINVIYKHEGVYKRIWLNPATNQYEYHEVVDREFPYLGKPLEIFDFTYDATRMGSAPTISAQGVMWFADKDEDNNDVTLEDLWLARCNDCHVSFNGENLYLKQVPTCSKDNEDARYKYDIDFVSERVVLERVYLYDVVQPFVSERPITESAKFSFYGDIYELAKRVNSSLLRSGLASLVRKYVSYPSEPELIVPYLTYEQWTRMSTNPASLLGDVFANEAKMRLFERSIYNALSGDYNRYLEQYIYENEGGVYSVKGYQCQIGKDKKGELIKSEECLITFDNNTVHEALQRTHDTYGLQYYITLEKDDSGSFTGNTIIMIADCEHDFADIDGDDYMRDEDGIPTTSSPFDYGVDNELLSKEKTNTTDKIVTRITGVGSSENIPWYYPNPTADGWIKPVYKRSGEVQSTEVGYPQGEDQDYEKYLKNRLGDVLQWGMRVNYIDAKYNAQYYTYDSLLGHVYEYKYAFKVTDETNILHFNAICERYDSSSSITILKDGQTYSEIPTLFTEVIAEIPEGSYEILFRMYVNNIVLKTTAEYYHHQENVTYTHGTTTEVIVVECFSQIKTLYLYLGGSVNQSDWFWYSDFADPAGSRENVVTPARGKTYYAWHNNDETSGTVDKYQYANDGTRTITQNCPADVDEFVRRYMTGFISTIRTDGWYKKGVQKVSLEDFGLTLPDGLTPSIDDTIEFQRLKWITPQPNLMPEVYTKTDGERRFYNAVNYPLTSGTPDPMIGEETSGGQIINPIYYKEDSTTHFDFENEYIQSRPHEHIENFDDVKPTITGQTNTVDGRTLRIDVVEEFAYDELDNDEIWENSDDGNATGEYKHPYFFAKLRPLGFNLFDHALQDDMVLSMTTGHCGACNFKIGVDENTKKNPVQIWKYDVYEGGDYATKVFKYHAGSLRRHVDTANLYYDVSPGDATAYIHVDSVSSLRRVIYAVDSTVSFDRRTYSAREVIDGEVGSLRKDNKSHFDGDVVTNGSFIESQQDTSENYVWIALLKDTDTYGEIMPSARPDYGDGNFSVYVRPKSISDVHTSTSTDSEDEENADKFVLTNIRIPQVYLRRAEREFSKRLVSYMYENNYQKFNFSIKFSRIFLAQNPTVDENLNENSVLYVSFNNKTYRQYVKHYTYRMTKDTVLPEISVDMNEELSVSRTAAERQTEYRLQEETTSRRHTIRAITELEDRIDRRTVGRYEDVVVGGNIVNLASRKSLIEMAMTESRNADNISVAQIDMAVNHFRKDDFQLFNGTDLKIGDSLFLPTAHKDGDSIKTRKWDSTTSSFVDDDTKTYNIEGTSAYNNIVKGLDQIDRAVSCASVTIGGIAYNVNYALPPERDNPDRPRPDICEQGGDLWFREDLTINIS